MTGEQYVAEWPLWSTTARVVVREAGALEPARLAVEECLGEMTAVADRFDPTSEISLLAVTGAADRTVSPLLARTLRQALRVAGLTDGAVDPTVGSAMVGLGYDSAAGPSDGPGAALQVTVGATWRDVLLVGDRLTLPPGVLLDLGSVGKALAVDLAALRAWDATGSPVLVSVGGDLRAVGPTSGARWLIEVAESPAGPASAWVEIAGGGLATSSTTVRTWHRGATDLHHVLDPKTGLPAAVHWRTATVAAATCLDANAASTAALVKGAAAASWIRRQGLPARLVHRDGTVLAVGGWPAQDAA